jgi:hypothetical protein
VYYHALNEVTVENKYLSPTGSEYEAKKIARVDQGL